MKEKEQIIDDILTRGVSTFLDPGDVFRKKLLGKADGSYTKDVVIKLGADPTRPDLHLGHAVVLRKLRKMQELGCKVVFILGDFTTYLGDPTGKSKTRPKLYTEEEDVKTSPRVSVSEEKKIEFEAKESSAPEKPLSQQIAENMKTYVEQINKILLTDEKHFSWIKNSDWFLGPTDMQYGPGANASITIHKDGTNIKEDISVSVDPNSMLGKTILYEKTRMQTAIKKDVLTLISMRGLLWTLQHITHAQLVNRDMFQDRIKNNQELYMHEMLYPVVQGIDSFAIAQIYGSCDLEIGGSDQTFNILMGRDVMKANNIEPQSVLTFKVLEGLDGKEKMSKSLDNYIGLLDTAEDMYGKVMSIPDSSIINYFELCTYTTLDRIEEIKKEIAGGKVNPKDIKMELARQIVAEYHGEKNVKEAEEDFITKFQKKEIPDEIDEFKVEKETLLIDAVLANRLVESKGEFRRLLDEGAVTDLKTKEKISDPQIKIEQELTLKIGKKRFVKFTI